MLLEVADVRFAYGRSARARAAAPPVLDGVRTRIAHGSLTGLLGPNGSGKTTLLRLMAGALTPMAGRVQIDGRDVGTLPRRLLARRLAVVPQETHLSFDYTALEIVLMGRYPHLGPFEIEGPADLAAAERAMAATGTARLADRAFDTLSGGEKQRVVIASALAQLDDAAPGTSQAAPGTRHQAPGTRVSPLLLLDEPTASLDLRYQIELAALLGRLHDREDMTIVLTTHDLRFARSICTDIVAIRGGRVLAQGAPGEVLTPALIAELYGIDRALAAEAAG